MLTGFPVVQMPRMLFSYALLCFALAGSSATQTDSHRDTKPVIAHGTNQKPVPPPQPDYGPGILHRAAFNPNLGIERTDAIVNNDDLKTADKNDPVEGLYPRCLHWSSPRCFKACLRFSSGESEGAGPGHI